MSKPTWYEIAMDEQRKTDIDNATDMLERDIKRADDMFTKRWEEIVYMRKQLRGE